MKRSPKKYCQINQNGFNTFSFDFVGFHWYWGTMDLEYEVLQHDECVLYFPTKINKCLMPPNLWGVMWVSIRFTSQVWGLGECFNWRREQVARSPL